MLQCIMQIRSAAIEEDKSTLRPTVWWWVFTAPTLMEKGLRAKWPTMSLSAALKHGGSYSSASLRHFAQSLQLFQAQLCTMQICSTH